MKRETILSAGLAVCPLAEKPPAACEGFVGNAMRRYETTTK